MMSTAHKRSNRRYDPNRATKTDRTAREEVEKKHCEVNDVTAFSQTHTASVTQIRSTDKNVNFVLCEIPLYANQVCVFVWNSVVPFVSIWNVSECVCKHIIIAHHKK